MHFLLFEIKESIKMILIYLGLGKKLQDLKFLALVWQPFLFLKVVYNVIYIYPVIWSDEVQAKFLCSLLFPP